MSEPGSFPNPFEGMLGDLAKMLGSLSAEGPVNWDMARQFALWVASDGRSEPNVDPVERMRLEELLRVADLHVAQATGLATAVTGRVLTALPVARGEWARRTLDAYRPLIERLAGSLGALPEPEPDAIPDPAAQLLGGLPQVLGPFLMAAMAGSMVGHLAQRSLGQYDLPVPRPPSDELLIVPANLDAFAEEWSLPADDLRLWVCLHEVTLHAVLGLPHVSARLHGLLLEYAGGFDADPDTLESKLGDLDPSDPESLTRLMGDPETLLGAVQTPAQRDVLSKVESLSAAMQGYVDHVMDVAGRNLIGSYGMLTEALRRRRVEDAPGNRYVGSLFGLELTQAVYDRGGAFVRGVVERAGEEGLARLWHSPRELPTPAELDAPGLWLERIDIPDA